MNSGGSSAWLKKKACLEAVYKSLRRYIRDNTSDLEFLTAQEDIDLDLIAEHDDVQQTMKVRGAANGMERIEATSTNMCQLLAVFLMAALHSSKKETYIVAIQEKLDEVSQGEIMKLFDEVWPRLSFG